ncbi:MAG: hypothetical protein L6R41_002639 [Letrouitia leprolyta]|nr:MAG: hypothetical protein L6R41_002639 [Letrouitia leprolyta]
MSRSSNYPELLIVPSLQEHKQTFVILHGRSSNAPAFGSPLLDARISNIKTFQSSFPYAQVVFSTTSLRRAKIYHRSMIHQRFDNGSLQTPNDQVELQVEGLRETATYIHSLVRKAVDQVSAENVVLGGLSQGCAAAMISLLTWDGEPIAAGFGMCGWLPFRIQMEGLCSLDMSNDDDELGNDDFFEASEEEATTQDAPAQAISFLCEELGFEERNPLNGIPAYNIFLRPRS